MILSKNSFISAGSSAFSQSASFLTSLALATSEGVVFYSQLGLAHATLITFIFLLDLGFGLYFSREISLGLNDWKKKWSLMLGLKLSFAILFCPVLVGLWWWIYGEKNIGTQYLLMAWPAAFISIFNMSSVLYGLGRVKEAAIGLLIVPSIYLIISIIALNFVNKNDLPVMLGLGYVLSWVCQILYFLIVSSDIFRIKVNFSMSVIPLAVDSFRIWRIALVGALYDRLVSFVIANIAPSFVAFYLLCDQVLQALITLFMQAQRAHFPDLANALTQKIFWGKVTKYCINFQLLISIIFNSIGILFHLLLYKKINLDGYDSAIFLYLFSGFLLICSAPLFTILILLKREGHIFIIITLAHLITIILWLITMSIENIYLAIVIRIFDAVLVWLGFLLCLKNYLKLKSIFLIILGFAPLIGLFFPLIPHIWLIAPSIGIFISVIYVIKIRNVV